MRKGVPDLVILHSGRVMGLEVKGPGGALSREQKEFRVEWERAGGIMPWSDRWKKEQRCWKSGKWSRQVDGAADRR